MQPRRPHGHAVLGRLLRPSPSATRRLPARRVDHAPNSRRCSLWTRHGRRLPEDWTKFLDDQSRFEFGLLNTVAEILDELIVRPGLEEIDVVPEPTWWQKWWDRIGEFQP